MVNLQMTVAVKMKFVLITFKPVFKDILYTGHIFHMYHYCVILTYKYQVFDSFLSDILLLLCLWMDL